MSEDQKTALAEENLSQEDALKKALAELENEDSFKKFEKSKQVFERARVTAEVNALYINKGRSGIGTRVSVSGTRGKSPIIVSYEQFDDSIPESLPKNLQDFVSFTKATEAAMLDYVIRGYNAASYEAASDPLAEFVVASWPADVQTTFRQAVRNYSKGLQIPLESAVETIRPGFIAKFGE